MPSNPAQLDRAHVWHPFTQMRDWLRREPIVIASGRGAVLRDTQGREYLDANSSIWTNLHGHRHPKLDVALRRQLGRIAHSSALGLANEPASRLAAQLVSLAAPSHNAQGEAGGAPAWAAGFLVDKRGGRAQGISQGQPVEPGSAVPALCAAPPRPLQKVFFSDDGSTALEVALKLAYEFARRTRGPRTAPRFLALEGAYHGDTVGAVSLGHIDLFHQAYAGLLFKSDAVLAPYCYRCPFNRATPERADARDYRRCNWECVNLIERKCAARQRRGQPYAGFVFEPLIQGAAGLIAQPAGWLGRAAQITRGHGALLIADEVMTGFGRCGPGASEARTRKSDPLFACQHEQVAPDFLCLAKGLTGGYLPMAATLTTQAVFDAFLGEYEEFKTFFHGHSYTANQLGAAAGLASLDLLKSPASLTARRRIERELRAGLQHLWTLPHVGDIRQVGLVAGVELVRDWQTREPLALRERAGIRVCEALARRGVLTRPIGNVIVLMPPYCTTLRQLQRMVGALHDSIQEQLGPGGSPNGRPAPPR